MSDKTKARNDSSDATLELRLLGPVELWRAGERVKLPRSKKARALLAYLAATGRSHRRERLCGLLWDVADDPRGALRWTLSRLRKLFNEGERCIEADREQVTLRTADMHIDALELAAAKRRGIVESDVEQLERLASLPRGEFLEGLDMPDFHNFNAWCIAQREQFREDHCRVLAELVSRLRDEPTRALPYARQRVQTDAFNVATQIDLLQLLLEAGKLEEARQHFDNGRRLYREVGAPGVSDLDRAWRQLLDRRERSDNNAASMTERVVDPRPEPAAATWPFVGRQAELSRLEAVMKEARRGGAPRVGLVIGEPGSGKSRLAERLTTRAQSAGVAVLSGRAYEAESTRPYGPWVDALQIEIHELVSAAQEDDVPRTRDALFAAAARHLATRADPETGAMLVLDDLQWLDRDSAELLHYLTRTYREGPLMILLLARAGELRDNETALRALRSMRRETHVEELEIQPLTKEEIAALVGRDGDLDLASIYEASAGNPLYAIELARAQSSGAATPGTLLQLIRERVERLPSHAADVLRWGAVLGHALDVERLEALSSSSLDELVDALERLERSALLRIDATRTHQRYVFSHDVVREAVYGELSYPRRRLMHRKVARMLEPDTANAAIATEVAHHAGLAGEALLGVKACVVAANQSLRVFANGDAEALAKRGLRLAEELEGADRISSILDLLHVQYAAHIPDREEAATRVRALAEEALDLGLTRAARLGFQMLSFLRWESSSMAAAHDNIMQAERVSRSGDPAERTVALAQAAKCLVLLERNMGQAEAFVMEADALASRAGRSTSAVLFATGMIAAYRGEHDEAVEAYREARQLAREHGQRLAEFCAVEHWVMLAVDRGGCERAVDLAEALADLGCRVRPGAEAPMSRGLLALVQALCGRDEAEPELHAAIGDLRTADAKYELAFLLTRWARHELGRGRTEEAARHAADALDVARAIRRPSETALACALLAECAADDTTRDEHLAALRELMKSDLSHTARKRAEALLPGA